MGRFGRRRGNARRAGGALLLFVLGACGSTAGPARAPQGEDTVAETKDPAAEELPNFDKLWNFGDPAGTEAKFRELLPRAEASGRTDYLAELLTQIARTQGLQQRYDDARETLDRADALVGPDMHRPRVRSLLERGRTYNSGGDPPRSVPLFEEALRTASANGLDFYAVDAAHMLGIATKGEDSLRWNERAIELAETAKEERAKGWLGALYNNTGWTYYDMGRFEDALRMFGRDFEHETSKNRVQQTGIARWAMAKAMRRLGRVEEALRIQREEVLPREERQGNASEGYGREEIGECLLALGREAEATPEFARAWELLHEDPWLKQDEPDRLARLKRLGGVE